MAARIALAELPDQLAVIAYDDPVIEAHGYRPDHPVTLWGYAPILGPSAIILYLHLGAIVEASTGPVTVDTADLMAGIGIGRGLARNSPAAKTVARLAAFDVLRRNRAIIAVRRALPPLPEYRRRKLPATARAIYDNLTARPSWPPHTGRAPQPLSAQIPLPCPRSCPHPLTVHSTDLGCWLCDCTYGRP
jgi:hypothetical protein